MKCRHKPHAKRKSAYGGKRVAIWCEKCDAELVNPIPNKKRARQYAKKQVKKDENKRFNDLVERENFSRKLRF